MFKNIKEKVLELVETKLKDKGLTLDYPVLVSRKLFSVHVWRIFTNANARGGNRVITFNIKTNEIFTNKFISK